MIRAFKSTDTVFDTNGDAVIRPTRAIVKKVDNGDYYLDFSCGIEYAEFIKAGNILVADTPQGAQPFRIEARFESTRSKISLKAWHISYDTENYVIADSYVVNKNCADALAHLNQATDNPSPFKTGSNITTINSFRCVRKSLFEAIETVLERWGGHLVRDGFNIRIDLSTGEDLGVTIQYKKNLKDIRVTEDWSAVTTKLLPVGKDGLTLPELYVYSSVQYDIPFSRVVSFDQDLDEELYPTEEEYIEALREDLRAKAKQYLNISQYPQINYTVSANVDNISDTGDIVEVYDDRLGVSLKASVISFEYNCLTGKYDSVEFGTLGQSLSNLLSGVSNTINTAMGEFEQNINSYLQVAVEIATSEIWKELGGGNIIVSSDQIMIVDALPAERAIFCYKIDKNGISFSSGGIGGQFRRGIYNNSKLDASVLKIEGLSLSDIKAGTLVIGGSNYTSLKILSQGNIEIGKADTNGLSIRGENVYGSLFFVVGEREVVDNRICSGYASSNGRALYFTLPLTKSTKNVGISVQALKINARGVNGAVWTITSSGKDVIADSSLTVTAEKHDRDILISVSSSSALVSSGNTPISVEVVSSYIDFVTL